MVGVEVPGQRLDQVRQLAAHLPVRQIRHRLSVGVAATSSASICRADTVVTLEATTDSLIEASSSSFSTRTASRVRSPISATR